MEISRQEATWGLKWVGKGAKTKKRLTRIYGIVLGLEANWKLGKVEAKITAQERLKK